MGFKVAEDLLEYFCGKVGCWVESLHFLVRDGSTSGGEDSLAAVNPDAPVDHVHPFKLLWWSVFDEGKFSRLMD
jgi:hypothetical protein